MSDLLADIYDKIQAVYFYLSGDLSREKLSRDGELKRSKFAQSLEELLNKLNSHQSNGSHDVTIKPPPPIPPSSGDTPPKSAPPIPDHEPTDYLAFEPAHLNGEEPQELYEAMEPEAAEDDQELYEETEGAIEEPTELYEEPVASSRPSTANGSVHGMTPQGSRENSGSGVEYMDVNRSKVHEPDVALEWSSVYQIPASKDKIKVSQLEGISIKGPLEKLGGKSHKTWQKRYCVMAGPLMYFYEKEGSKTFNNFISVPSFTVEYSEKLSDKKHFAFKLTQLDHTGKKKDYCFRSMSSENREKWVTAMKRVIGMSQSQTPRGATTLPRMPTSGSHPVHVPEKRRSLTLPTVEEPQELYEPVEGAGVEEDDQQDEYVAVSPSDMQGDLESSEEYIDVQPHEEDPQEVYEEPPITLNDDDAPPPPPTSPPPGPPREHPFPPFSSSSPPPPAMPPKPPVEPSLPPKPKPSPSIGKKPAPPPIHSPQPPVDTNKVYMQPTNGINLEQVFVSLWDFAAMDKDELNLKRGDLIFVKDPKENADWWYGELLDKEASKKLDKNGFFPRTYTSHAFQAITA